MVGLLTIYVRPVVVFSSSLFFSSSAHSPTVNGFAFPRSTQCTGACTPLRAIPASQPLRRAPRGAPSLRNRTNNTSRSINHSHNHNHNRNRNSNSSTSTSNNTSINPIPVGRAALKRCMPRRQSLPPPHFLPTPTPPPHRAPPAPSRVLHPHSPLHPPTRSVHSAQTVSPTRLSSANSLLPPRRTRKWAVARARGVKLKLRLRAPLLPVLVVLVVRPCLPNLARSHTPASSMTRGRTRSRGWLRPFTSCASPSVFLLLNPSVPRSCFFLFPFSRPSLSMLLASIHDHALCFSPSFPHFRTFALFQPALHIPPHSIHTCLPCIPFHPSS